MQGFILQIRGIRDEDLIVYILTNSELKTLYRFYGKRHSVLNVGRKIDFEEENDEKFLPKLRNILHLGYVWERELERLFFWQRFCVLLSKHLEGVHSLDSIYFDTLDNGAKKLSKQHPLRVVLEMYATLLHFEGRLQFEGTCFLCNEKLEHSVSLAQGFVLAHPKCLKTKSINLEKIQDFFHTQSTIYLETEEVEELWRTLNLGF
ncbi:recombination protein RecO [Helicobacter cetorum]|uniref:Putative recombination protein RecO n=1 Tax=Helicobacter cetorum (strain ATCC BAA-540 / CCUG 52418 / MIT 99-5656) TaxID=1163745 RepID=I0ER62_HELCM|nr:recombination protein RecO [Helicobacter cetorum]AFI05431.1 putative recombination protein RecO [Helicobacter cetorum MIT 99-5656]